MYHCLNIMKVNLQKLFEIWHTFSLSTQYFWNINYKFLYNIFLFTVLNIRNILASILFQHITTIVYLYLKNGHKLNMTICIWRSKTGEWWKWSCYNANKHLIFYFLQSDFLDSCLQETENLQGLFVFNYQLQTSLYSVFPSIHM